MGKTIKNHPNYSVSDQGEVKNNRTNKVLTQGLNAKGYYRIELDNHKIAIHRLVAEAFIDNPNNLPCINHKNEIRTDNRAENLEGCDYKYNRNYGSCDEKIKQSLFNNGLTHPVLIDDTMGFRSVHEAARYLKADRPWLLRCLKTTHRCKKHKVEYAK